ncbi:hypothetical protein D5086_011207 [Populus alba]|uniref:Uncharacterized protein n=1 Tax=Populus alba TaxID=43335 RepID=A0ACC4CBJ3_POPAL
MSFSMRCVPSPPSPPSFYLPPPPLPNSPPPLSNSILNYHYEALNPSYILNCHCRGNGLHGGSPTKEIEVLFHLVFALIRQICHEDHCGSRLLSGSCATLVGFIFDERRGKVVVVRAVV